MARPGFVAYLFVVQCTTAVLCRCFYIRFVLPLIDPDKCRIFVAIVDWSQPHTVVSGTGSTTGAWDPANGADVVSEAGKVVGYGSMWIDQSTPGDALVSSEDALKIHWYEEKAPSPTGNYTIVISCAANAYGDYMTGYSKACLYVDDFEWVY